MMQLLRPHFATVTDDGHSGGGDDDGDAGGNGGDDWFEKLVGGPTQVDDEDADADADDDGYEDDGVFRMEPGAGPVALVWGQIVDNEEWGEHGLLLQARDVRMDMATVDYFREQMRLAAGLQAMASK